MNRPLLIWMAAIFAVYIAGLAVTYQWLARVVEAPELVLPSEDVAHAGARGPQGEGAGLAREVNIK